MAAKLKILVVNGPNLNMLGKREPEKYGTQTLSEIMSELTNTANSLNVELTHFQSNGEQALIERIHNAWQAVDCIIINPAAFTHTSVALRDALLSVDIPFYEIYRPVNFGLFFGFFLKILPYGKTRRITVTLSG